MARLARSLRAPILLILNKCGVWVGERSVAGADRWDGEQGRRSVRGRVRTLRRMPAVGWRVESGRREEKKSTNSPLQQAARSRPKLLMAGDEPLMAVTNKRVACHTKLITTGGRPKPRSLIEIIEI